MVGSQQYTINRQRTELRATIAEIRKEYQNWKPATKDEDKNQKETQWEPIGRGR
jgi:hypothetical protein